MTLILIWTLLTAPYDRMMCSMWVSQAPTPKVMASAGCVWTPAQAAGFVWRAIEISSGKVACQRPASELPTITCDIWPLDHYLIRVYQPDYIEQFCTAMLTHSGPPTQDELKKQCPAKAQEAYQSGVASWSLVSSYPDPGPDPAPAPICPLPQLKAEEVPASVKALATSKDYFLLEYELAWWYGPAYSVVDWQNQYDPYIWDAGILQRVPPRLLKGIFGRESQFWPLWSPERKNGDEVGLGQLTDAGADLVLRYSPGLFNQFCPIASWECWRGYDHLPATVQRMMRDVLRGRLMVSGTPREAAAQAAYTIPTWGQILQAYYCAAGEIVRQAGQSPSWDYALATYHAGPECVRGGQICEAGASYLREVKQ